MLKRSGKKRFIAAAMVGLFIFLGTGCNLIKMNPEAEKKQVVAKIGEEEITKQDFNYYLTIEKLNWKMQGQEFPADDETLGQVKSQLLDVIVENQLLLQAAMDENIEVEEEDIVGQVEESVKTLKEDIGGEEDYQAFLKENDITPEEFQDFIKKYFLDNQYIVGLYQELTKDVTVSDEEITEYYEENKKAFDPSTVEAKHILAESKEQAEEIEKKAKNGEDFDDLMEEYREKEGIREASDLGEFTYTRMVPEFSEAAFALEPGEVSGVVETQHGYHVLKVEKKNQEEVQKLEEVKETIETQLQSDAMQEVFYQYYVQLQEEIDVKTYPEKL